MHSLRRNGDRNSSEADVLAVRLPDNLILRVCDGECMGGGVPDFKTNGIYPGVNQIKRKESLLRTRVYRNNQFAMQA